MISLQTVTLRRGARTLLENTSFTLFAGQKVGVVGRNGTGKSSLFALLLGELSADKGEATLPRHLAVATVAQETPALPVKALDFALDGDVELREVERRLARAEAAHDAEAQFKLHERLNQIDGYAAPARAAKLLDGLGFSHAQQSRTVAEFSGGWRMRLNLARALMCRSDLMLLDEPTNHLDLDAVIWLQDWLRSYPGTLLLISHDREFLDAVTTHTLHLERQQATLYSGNYSAFERMRAERLTQQQSAYQQQQQRIAHLQSFIDRFKAKATKARQAQSRIKQLERMSLLAPAHLDSEFGFDFFKPERVPSPLLKLDEGRCGYLTAAGEHTVLAKVKLSLEPGDRIGLLGANGAGKSTLVRVLAGAEAPLGGRLHRDPALRVGYFAQHQLEQLDPQASPLLHLRRLAPEASEQTLRDYLGGFNFRGDRVFEPTAPFSGGEKARLCLALVVWQKPNLLLLDEPTNHLDLDMRHALETALQTFAGAVVLVSHDRHLMASTCDEFWRVAEGRVEAFDGDLDDYAQLLLRGPARPPRPAPAPVVAATAAVAPAVSRDPRQDKTLREALRKCETRLERLNRKLAECEARLADSSLYEPARRDDLAAAGREQASLKEEIARCEAEWLATLEQLEG
ncbi:MAG TPA: ATP-binding cassette domain-containing protein [Nevskiaceae bacterium]|nr:ATP-binding cassette domain-containing protein [Nevskiaceae bacterium]